MLDNRHRIDHRPGTGMLERFMQAKQKEVAILRRTYAQNGPPAPHSERSPSLYATLREKGPGAIIAEYKPASPSKGPIAPELSPEQAGEIFVQGGAAAVSVLTDASFFGSSIQALAAFTRTRLPLLRKDFIVHPLQVRQTASTPASAFLLIVRMFPAGSELLTETFQAGLDAGLEPVVEVFDRRDLARAKALGARIILVNSRNLDTLELDTRIHHELIPKRQDAEVWICASGLSLAAQIRSRAEMGYAACLIGTSIMESSDKTQALLELSRAESHGVHTQHAGGPAC